MRYELTRTTTGWIATHDGDHRRLDVGLDVVLTSDDPLADVAERHASGAPAAEPVDALAPIESQEVWACGVTYLRSRDARMVESERSGGDVFYDLVYDADRPEIFMKATPHPVVGPGQPVRIRADSTWDVPESELTLVVSSAGAIVGATIGNDMSSRSIEGENPLYIPQAKIYSGSAALGPHVVLTDEPWSPDAAISMSIERAGETVYDDATAVGRIKRPFAELVEYLFRDNAFPAGVFLMTGTGIVPDDGFTLTSGDVVTISIDGIGTLTNPVA